MVSAIVSAHGANGCHYQSEGFYRSTADVWEHVLCQQNNGATRSVMVQMGELATVIKFDQPTRYRPSKGWHDRHMLVSTLMR